MVISTTDGYTPGYEGVKVDYSRIFSVIFRKASGFDDVYSSHHNAFNSFSSTFFLSILKNMNILVGERLGKTSKRKLAEYVSEKYSEIPSFLNKYGCDENEDYSIAYRTT